MPHLIKGKSSKGVERYFMLVGRLWGWATDPANALQFARPADARAIADAFCPTSDSSVVEHPPVSKLREAINKALAESHESGRLMVIPNGMQVVRDRDPATKCESLAELEKLILRAGTPFACRPIVRVIVPVTGQPATLAFEPPWTVQASSDVFHVIVHAQQCRAMFVDDRKTHWEVEYRISVERCQFQEFHEPAEYDG